MHNRFNNLGNCYYAFPYNTMIVSCYKFLKLAITKVDFLEEIALKHFSNKMMVDCVFYVSMIFFLSYQEE